MPEYSSFTPVYINEPLNNRLSSNSVRDNLIRDWSNEKTESSSQSNLSSSMSEKPKSSSESKIKFYYNSSEEDTLSEFLNQSYLSQQPHSVLQVQSQVLQKLKIVPDSPIVGTRYSRGNLRAEILDLLQRDLGWLDENHFHLGETVRKRNAGIGSSTSHHFLGNAVDIIPRGKMTFLQLKNSLIHNANVRKFFAENGLGIIDESTPEIRALHSWKSTGNHYHIGPDALAVRTWKQWLKEAGYAKKGGILKASGGANLTSYQPVRLPWQQAQSEPITLQYALSSMGLLDDSAPEQSKPKLNETTSRESTIERAQNVSRINWTRSEPSDNTRIDQSRLQVQSKPVKTELQKQKPKQMYNFDYGALIKPEVLNRAKIAIDYFQQHLGLTKDQAIGFAGVLAAENEINPASYNKAEKAGTLKGSKANGKGYGAGIGSWSLDLKEDIKPYLIQAAKKDKGAIENYTLEEQLEAYCNLIKNKSRIYQLLKNTKTIEEAADIVTRGIMMGGMTGNLARKDYFDKASLFNSGRGKDDKGQTVNGYDQIMYNVNPNIGLGRISAARGLYTLL